jgi:hypothetical protein
MLRSGVEFVPLDHKSDALYRITLIGLEIVNVEHGECTGSREKLIMVSNFLSSPLQELTVVEPVKEFTWTAGIIVLRRRGSVTLLYYPSLPPGDHRLPQI